MSSFSDEVIVFGVSAEECLEAVEEYAAEVWSSIDEAMDLLWESEEERSRAQENFTAEALLSGPIEEREGGVLLEIDSEADAAAEKISALLGSPAISVQVLRGRWCKFLAFDHGRRIGWLFWVDTSSVGIEGEILPAPVASALGTGGWIGDPEVFEVFIPPGAGISIPDILGHDWDNPAELAEAIKASMGFGSQARIPL
jgi:hypothetical protein